MLQWLNTHVSSVSSISDVCCKCLIWMFQSRSGVAYIAMAIHACLKCFFYFRSMLQMFYLNVSKIDLGKAHVTVAIAPSWVTMPPWVTARGYRCCCCVHAGAWNGVRSGWSLCMRGTAWPSDQDECGHEGFGCVRHRRGSTVRRWHSGSNFQALASLFF
jgi:hypothetical protein